MNSKRMRLRDIILALAVAVALSLSASAQAIDQSALDALMNEAMKYWQTTGSAVVAVRGDEVVYLKGGKIKVIKWRNIDNVGPAGSINASVRDLSKPLAVLTQIRGYAIFPT